MNIKKIHIITVGKPKMPFYKDALAFYGKRIGHYCSLEESVLKDGDSALPVQIRKEKEGQAILKVLKPQSLLICMDEHGKNLTSPDLAKLLDTLALSAVPTLLIGGAYGIDQSLLNQASHVLSFGKQTLPHELAQVTLYEQVYRALSILNNTGYHHGE